jgi:uncharacterized protein YjiS (DUF1127 family)
MAIEADNSRQGVTIMTAKANSLFARYRNWQRYRSTVRELEQLSTRELDDIGIARGDIYRVSRNSIL